MKPSFATSRSGSSGTHPTPRPPFGQSAGRPQAGGQGPGGRKPGGQSGHPGHHRHCLPPERVKNIVPYVPTVCTQCQAPLPAEPGPGDPDPSWRQVAELPELAAVITEHQGHAPVPAVATSIVAGFPRRFAPTSSGHALAAAMSYFSGRHHLGRRAVKEVVETVFEAPTSLGSISALKAETCAALATPYQVAETSGAGLPASRNRGSSGRHSRSAITGPCWGLNGYATGGHFPAGVGHRSHASENPATYLHHEVVSKLRPTSQMRASHTGSYTLEFGKSLTTTHTICRRAQK